MGYKELKKQVGLNTISKEKKIAVLLMNKFTKKSLEECSNMINLSVKEIR